MAAYCHVAYRHADMREMRHGLENGRKAVHGNQCGRSADFLAMIEFRRGVMAQKMHAIPECRLTNGTVY